MLRYFVSMYTDGPATRWNVIDRNTQEWVRRFASDREARDYAAELERKYQSRRYYAVIRGELLHGSLKDLSEYYCEIRDETGEGCSTFRAVDVRVSGTGEAIGHISYNGRVWDQPLSDRFCAFTGFNDTSKLLYDNRAAAPSPTLPPTQA